MLRPYQTAIIDTLRATLCWKVWDGGRYRMHVRYVGEDGIKPNTPYRFEDGKVREGKP